VRPYEEIKSKLAELRQEVAVKKYIKAANIRINTHKNVRITEEIT
jgi:hypothetical protein